MGGVGDQENSSVSWSQILSCGEVCQLDGVSRSWALQLFADLKTKVMETSYQASETEMIVLEKFLGNYLEVRLSNRFLLEVGKPVMELISFFESQKIRIQDRYSKLVLLLHSFLSKFMKNAGI